MDHTWKQGKITLENGYLHYYRIGRESNIQIILIHGFTDNGLCWTEVATALRGKYDVIIPEMKSHGMSSRIQNNETIDMALDVKKLIQTLETPCPIIIGHSMGAMITYQLGTRFPDLSKAIILEDPPWRLPLQDRIMNTNRSIYEWAENLEFQSLEEIEAINRKDHPYWTHEMIRIMSESKKQYDSTSVGVFSKILEENNREWLSTINQLRIPALLIVGNPQLGGIVSDEVALKVKELNPGILIRKIPTVGHLMHFDKPNEFTNIVVDFVREVENH